VERTNEGKRVRPRRSLGGSAYGYEGWCFQHAGASPKAKAAQGGHGGGHPNKPQGLCLHAVRIKLKRRTYEARKPSDYTAHKTENSTKGNPSHTSRIGYRAFQIKKEVVESTRKILFPGRTFVHGREGKELKEKRGFAGVGDWGKLPSGLKGSFVKKRKQRMEMRDSLPPLHKTGGLGRDIENLQEDPGINHSSKKEIYCVDLSIQPIALEKKRRAFNLSGKDDSKGRHEAVGGWGVEIGTAAPGNPW